MFEYEELIHDIRNRVQQPKLEFEKNEKLRDLLDSLEEFARMDPSSIGSVQQDHVILDMKVESRNEVNIKLVDDVHDPYISGCTFLSNDNILLCDNSNKSVKLLDSDMSIKNSLKLSYGPCGPWDVAAVGKSKAVITYFCVPFLQYIYKYPDLKLGKNIILPGVCFGLNIDKEEIYTTKYGHNEIWRLDRAGNIISKIALTQNCSCRSVYLGLCCLPGSNPRVYLTDLENSRVTCVQMDGKIVFQYEDKGQLRGPAGIYTGPKFYPNSGNCFKFSGHMKYLENF